MNNKILIVVVVIIFGAVIFSAGGYFAGVFLEKEKTGSQIEKLEKLTSVTSLLSSSKLIVSIIGYGKVTDISGRKITLTTGSESLQVSIREDAQMYSFVAPAFVEGKISEISAQKVIKFEDIKVGDNLNVSTKMLADGQMEGLSVAIFSPTVKISQ